MSLWYQSPISHEDLGLRLLYSGPCFKGHGLAAGASPAPEEFRQHIQTYQRQGCDEDRYRDADRDDYEVFHMTASLRGTRLISIPS